MKKLLSTTAIALLLAGGTAAPVLAADNQDTMTPGQTQNGAAPDQMGQTDMGQTNMGTSDMQAANRGGDVEMLNQLPADQRAVSQFYQQAVYDQNDNEIGDTNDFLLDGNGRVTAVIIGVGGFLGVGEKNVAIPFDALSMRDKDGETHVTVNTTKAALEKAPGYTYDDDANKWVPAKEGNAS